MNRHDTIILSHRLEVDWKLEYLLRGHKPRLMKVSYCLFLCVYICLGIRILQYLRESKNTLGFLRDLKHLVDQLEATCPFASPPLPQAYYQHIIDDLASIGWDQ